MERSLTIADTVFPVPLRPKVIVL